MRKLALSLIVAFAVYVTAAAAQASGGMGSQGTQGQSPSMQQPGTAPGTAQPGTPGQAPDMGPSTTDQNSNTANTNSNKGEKKLKGCVESESGQYVLATKKGTVLLAGQDVSAHVGHEVTLKGTWENSASNSNASPTASSSGGEAWSKGTFNVTDVKMDSETCKIKTKDNSGNMGTSGNSGMSGSSTGSSTGAGSSTGSSTGTSGTGSNTGSGTGSSTTPPQ